MNSFFTFFFLLINYNLAEQIKKHPLFSRFHLKASEPTLNSGDDSSESQRGAQQDGF